jgi:hypothetical protein
MEKDSSLQRDVAERLLSGREVVRLRSDTCGLTSVVKAKNVRLAHERYDIVEVKC